MSAVESSETIAYFPACGVSMMLGEYSFASPFTATDHALSDMSAILSQCRHANARSLSSWPLK